MNAKKFVTYCHSLYLCNCQADEVITKNLIVKSDVK